VSAVTETVSTGLAAPAAPRLADPPRLADGTELMGGFRDSGDSQPPSLVGPILKNTLTRGTRPDPCITGMRPAAHATALSGRHYAAAAVAAISVTLAAVTGGGSLYLIATLIRRAVTAAPRWTAGHPARRLLAILTAAACVTALALYWTAQNQFHGW
jgi:hypothetical protein